MIQLQGHRGGLAAICCCCRRAHIPVRCGAPPLGDFLGARCPNSHDLNCPALSGSAWKGPRHLRFRRPAPHRRDRSHFGLRLRARIRHSRQGEGPDANLRVLVRPDACDCREPRADDRSSPVPARSPRRRRAARGPFDAGAKNRAAGDRVRGPRLPVGVGLEGLPGVGRGLRHPAAARTARVGPAARADFHAGHQGAKRPRHQHQRGRRRGDRRPGRRWRARAS